VPELGTGDGQSASKLLSVFVVGRVQLMTADVLPGQVHASVRVYVPDSVMGGKSCAPLAAFAPVQLEWPLAVHEFAAGAVDHVNRVVSEPLPLVTLGVSVTVPWACAWFDTPMTSNTVMSSQKAKPRRYPSVNNNDFMTFSLGEG
jgi:hypothetical protein